MNINRTRVPEREEWAFSIESRIQMRFNNWGVKAVLWSLLAWWALSPEPVEPPNSSAYRRASTGIPYSFDSDMAGGTINFTAQDQCGGGVDWAVAQAEADKICHSWGYGGATPHHGIKQSCLQPKALSGCGIMQHERVYRCDKNLPKRPIRGQQRAVASAHRG